MISIVSYNKLYAHSILIPVEDYHWWKVRHYYDINMRVSTGLVGLIIDRILVGVLLNKLK